LGFFFACKDAGTERVSGTCTRCPGGYEIIGS